MVFPWEEGEESEEGKGEGGGEEGKDEGGGEEGKDEGGGEG